MKKIFVTGGTSLFGIALLKKIPFDFQVILMEHHQTLGGTSKNPSIVKMSGDIRDNAQLKKIIEEIKPDLVIHAAAIGNVDYCEKNQNEAWQVNVGGTQNLIKALRKKTSPVIYLSTNAVFDGKKDIYGEEDKPHPINFYGKTKYQSEKLVQKSGLPWTIVRPITMYGWPPKGARANPVTWVLESLKNGDKLKIVDDVYLNPLYNHDLAKVLWKIIINDERGIFHIAGSEVLNRYQWALKVTEVFNLDKSLITPVKSSYFDGKIASRPSQTIYSIEKIVKLFKFKPKNIKQGLEAMFKENVGLSGSSKS